MKKESKETPDWRLILTICIGVVALAIIVTVWVKKSIENRNECIDNIPSKIWFEEDLEETFLTTNVCVLDIDDTGEGQIIVLIKIWIDNQEQYYRCLYKLKSFDSFNWHWELVRYL